MKIKSGAGGGRSGSARGEWIMAGNSTVHKKMMTIALSAVVVFVGIFSLAAIQRLQGNARVINYAGVVRGATQKLIKEELQGTQDDALIGRLDRIIEELLTGEGELGLPRLNDREFQSLMLQMKESWKELKEEISAVRQGEDQEKLFELSQEYFELADRTVTEAEQYSEKNAEIAKLCFFALTLFFFIVACALAWFSSLQKKKQKELLRAEDENREKREQLFKMMQSIQAPMNEISELIYVSDIENYDLLFINEAGRDNFKVEDIRGKKCYKVLQGLDAPCPFCTNSKLKRGENYNWEFTNQLTKRHYILKDRLIDWDGREARMEIAFDTTQAENEKIKLKYALDMENMVVECIRILYQGRDIAKDVNQALMLIGEFLYAERTYIFNIREDMLFNDFEWCRKNVKPQAEMLQGLPVSAINRWLPVFAKQQCVVIEDLEDYRKDSPDEYETLKAQDIKSLVAAPMEKDGVLIGFLGVDNPPVEKIANISAPLQTLCYFLLLAYRRAENEEQLSTLSFHDTLTSFYNRNKYIEDLETLSEQEISVGILYLDINGLKEVNDKLGHCEGDRLLVRAADKMKSVFRKEDCYRVGGDEFVIISQNIAEEKFEEKVAELRTKFEAEDGCRAAIGSRWAGSARNINQIVSDADASMYEDKKLFYRNNRKAGRYRHHSDEVLQLANPKILQSEMDKEQFVVYLQPKISAPDRTAVGAEALIRYLSKDGSLILPGHFLPVLEEAKTISQIDFYVFDLVCTKIKKWLEDGKRNVPVSVNFSHHSLVQPNFLENLKGICQKHGISPTCLEIEITESAEDVETTDMGRLISGLRREGFGVVIDDFGTDYANLSLLSSVEFDVLKLDRSMVRDVAVNRRSQEIIKSIADICRKMDIKLVAEGVEEEEQLEVLNSCGVELVQGYLFSRPIPIEEYENEYL